MHESEPTILLLEDEAIVQLLLKNILVLNGFRVLLAISARDALEQFRQRGEQIDLLIADLAIPDDSGVNVAAQCAQLSDKLRVIVTSGTPFLNWNDIDCTAFKRLGSERASHLQKPFCPDQLLKAVYDALGVRRESTSPW